MQISRDDNIKYPIAPHFVEIMRNDKMRCLCISYEKIELLWYGGLHIIKSYLYLLLPALP